MDIKLHMLFVTNLLVRVLSSSFPMALKSLSTSW